MRRFILAVISCAFVGGCAKPAKPPVTRSEGQAAGKAPRDQTALPDAFSGSNGAGNAPGTPGATGAGWNTGGTGGNGAGTVGSGDQTPMNPGLPSGGTPADGLVNGDVQDGSGCLGGGGSGDYYQFGKHTAKKGNAKGGYEVWIPDNLGTSGCKHPIVSWGNGTGVNGAMTFPSYGHYAKHLASYGFVVIMSHADGGSGSSGGRPLGEGIDWLLSSSEYKDKLAPVAGTFGHSQGGQAAVSLGGNHDKVKAIVSLQGYGRSSAKPTLALTGQQDTWVPNSASVYSSAPGPAFLAELKGADHVMSTTYPRQNDHGKKYGGAAVAFFLCYLDQDQQACTWLQGSGGKFCADPAWSKCESKKHSPDGRP